MPGKEEAERTSCHRKAGLRRQFPRHSRPASTAGSDRWSTPSRLSMQMFSKTSLISTQCSFKLNSGCRVQSSRSTSSLVVHVVRGVVTREQRCAFRTKHGEPGGVVKGGVFGAEGGRCGRQCWGVLPRHPVAVLGSGAQPAQRDHVDGDLQNAMTSSEEEHVSRKQRATASRGH